MDNLRRIVLTVSVFVFLTLSICGIVLSFRNIDSKKEDNIIQLEPSDFKHDVGDDPTDDGDDTDDKKYHNVLCIIKGEENIKNLYFLLEIKNSNELKFIFIPEDSKLSYAPNGKILYKNLAEFQSYGMDVLLEAVSGRLGEKVENYIMTDIQGFGTFVNYLTAGSQGVKFTYPVDNTFSLGGVKYRLSKDQENVDGGIAKGIIAFTKTSNDSYIYPLSNFYDGTDMARIKMASCFIREFAVQKMVKGISAAVETNYEYYVSSFLKSNAETNLDEDQIKLIPEIMLGCEKDNVKSLVFDLDNNSVFDVRIGDNGFIITTQAGY